MFENTKSITKLYPPKYIEIEKRFEEEVVMSELEQKKKKLAEIRELHKPLEHSDIIRHA